MELTLQQVLLSELSLSSKHYPSVLMKFSFNILLNLIIVFLNNTSKLFLTLTTKGGGPMSFDLEITYVSLSSDGEHRNCLFKQP